MYSSKLLLPALAMALLTGCPRASAPPPTTKPAPMTKPDDTGARSDSAGANPATVERSKKAPPPRPRLSVLARTPRVGQRVARADLLGIYMRWFRRPYSYMFSKSGISVGGAHGVFMAGIDGIILYGGFAQAIWQHKGWPRGSFYQRDAIGRLAGLKIYRRRSRKLASFSHFNPQIVRWGYQNLIPAVDDKILGVTAQSIYSGMFARFFRLMTAAYRHVQKLGAAAEQKAYSAAMGRAGFDGIRYQERRYAGALSAYSCSRNGTNFTPAMAIGFWVRRGIDGTAPELWRGLSKVMSRFDAAWWGKQAAGS